MDLLSAGFDTSVASSVGVVDSVSVGAGSGGTFLKSIPISTLMDAGWKVSDGE